MENNSKKLPETTVVLKNKTEGYSGSLEYFSGKVKVMPMISENETSSYSIAYVSFEAGARTAWHTHPLGQRLIIIEGDALIQEYGKPIVKVKAGDVVEFPKDVKHWHGASLGGRMTHAALTGVLNGESALWMEKVTDEEYQKAK